MTLKKKLTLGLGFLFLLIFVLVIFYSYNIAKLSADAQNILKDNYRSLIYSRNMTSALEDSRTAVLGIVFQATGGGTAPDYHLKLLQTARNELESNLKAQNGNITEINEQEYMAALNQAYALYAGICLRLARGEGTPFLFSGEYQPAFENLRHAVDDIYDLNMQAVERKSGLARRHAAGIIKLMAGVATFCLILAFGYFWYFPFYISQSIAHLSDRMRRLLEKAGLPLDLKTDDEAFVILQGIDLLENTLDSKDRPTG